MDWQQPIDLYCERIAPGLLAEPLNAISNLAFVVAGFWLAATLPRRFPTGIAPLPYDLLAGLIVVIGVGSATFHIFATRWAEMLDVLSIGLFVYFYVICFAHYVLDVRWRFAWMAAPAFWAFGVFVTGPFDRSAFSGSISYFPALGGLVLIGAGLRLRTRPGAGYFLLASPLFFVSISLRSMDLPQCTQWVWGTHWIWHLLNSLALTLAVLGLAKARERRRIPVAP
ncbi:MAG: ceramidase domain-containing protein [Panacagrimonas sp.]